MRSYYNDLNNRSAVNATCKWKVTPNGLAGLLKDIESFVVNEATLIHRSDDSAVLRVIATGKVRKKNPQIWDVNVTLEKVYNEWKIISIKKSR